MKTVHFVFDFASPNSYLVYKVLPNILEKLNSKLIYTPCLLGGIFKLTNNQSPMSAFAHVLGKNNYEDLEFERFIEANQIKTYVENPYFPVNTLIMMRGAIVAQNEGYLEEYVKVGFHHMWETPKKMSDPEIYKKAMSSSGLNGSDLLEKSQIQDVKDRLMENTKQAVEKGAFGTPTFFVQDQMFYGKERLHQIEKLLSD